MDLKQGQGGEREGERNMAGLDWCSTYRGTDIQY